MTNKSLVNKKYWEQLCSQPCKKVNNTEFSKLFSKYLAKQDDKCKIKMLEIGCLPARFLAFLSTQYNYVPEGIDYIKGSKKICEQTLKNMGIIKFKIYEEDFLKWKTNNKYDLVCSFGFIEHFIDPEGVVKKHISLLKKNAYIIIEIPNFSGLQKYLHIWLDKNNYNAHNQSIMNLSYFENILCKYYLKKYFLGYYGGLFTFWWNNNSPSNIQRLFYLILSALSKLTGRINLNNKYLSPYIILIAKK